MKIVVDSSLLSEALADADKAVSSKPVMEILSGILIQTTDDGLSVTGASERAMIQSYIPEEHVEIIRAGAVVLPKIALELIGKLNGEIEIDVDKGCEITILNKNEEVVVSGFDFEEFPRPPEIHWGDTTPIKGKDLKEFIKKTVFSVATETKMPEITGVNITLADNQMKFLATDRNRLASIEKKMEVNDFGSAIVEARGLAEVEKIIFDKDEIQFGFSKLQSGQVYVVFIKTDRFTFFSRVLEGQYPDVERILSRVVTVSKLRVNKCEFAKSLDLIYTLAKEEKMNQVRLAASETELTIRGNGKGMGKAKGEVNPLSLEGEPFTISLNAKYIIDLLKAIDSDVLSIEYTGKMTSVIFQGDVGEGSRYIVQPYRTEI
ncbi:DNA polymerase III subunit beta [Paenibacillus graminis]|uniref:DNA polymerase III subunit beta n=1 Tax=Paenibacillus graminis TaxID=189425 RepID=UPI002DB9D6FB|nr:DNA polymerase III subunit beta [Paenibacillus graminis]MEC0170294.1 DNA polymerase III subunit beta [Paenibacillus graminis]